MIEAAIQAAVADAVKAQLPILLDAMRVAVRRELDARLPTRLVTRDEAAEARHCSVDTIDRDIASGLLQVERIGRRGVRVRLPVSPEASEIAQLAREARG